MDPNYRRDNLSTHQMVGLYPLWSKLSSDNSNVGTVRISPEVNNLCANRKVLKASEQPEIRTGGAILSYNEDKTFIFILREAGSKRVLIKSNGDTG